MIQWQVISQVRVVTHVKTTPVKVELVRGLVRMKGAVEKASYTVRLPKVQRFLASIAEIFAVLVSFMVSITDVHSPNPLDTVFTIDLPDI